MSDKVYQLTPAQFAELRGDIAREIADRMTPLERIEFVRGACPILADRVEAKLGGLEECIELDLSFISRLTGLSRPTIQRRMSVIEDDGKHSVTLKSFLAHRAKRTKPPTAKAS